VRVDSWGPRAFSVSGSNIPERFADEENATMMAVIRSYKQNTQMIAQMQQGVMNRIQADAARANAQTDAINARRESSTAAFNQHMDNLDRSSKINQDYILDRSVVRDTQNAERGTVSNSYADSLVRNNPDRFQIVANQDLIKGKDY
jgi:negative regulator of sigma E activity